MTKEHMFERVCSPSIPMAAQADCLHCKNAELGTILIDGLCLKCHDKKVIEKDILTKFIEMAHESLDPQDMESLEDVLGNMCEARHINLKG